MSETVTRSVPKNRARDKVVRRHRVYDCLYDPLYTVSSEADHVRASVRAHTHRVRRVPEFGSMFSNLSHHPAYTVHLDPTDPVPASIDRRWRGHMEQRKEALQQLAGNVPNAQTWLKREECNVTGADRWKYFKRPLVPFAQQVPSDVIFALPREDYATTVVKRQPSHMTIGVQTNYRDSETQTDPYSPGHVTQPGTTVSELLQLTSLTFGRGLPAGTAEVEMIQRARARRVWEATLPPLDDLSQLDKRRRMMEKMEAREWAFREEEIQKLQETRLSVLKDLLRQRDEAQNEATKERLHCIYSRLHTDMERRLNRIHDDHSRSLRKLDASRRNMEGRLKQRGDVTVSFTRSVHNYKLPRHRLDSLKGLETGLSASVLKPHVKRPKVNISQDVSKEVELMNKYKALKEEEKEQAAKKPLRFLVRKEKPVPRPATPRVEEPPEGEEEAELAVIHLQRLLRGRSVQYKMLRDKENHMDLIRELRTTHSLQREEQEVQRADRELVIALKEQRDTQRDEAAQEEASWAAAVGTELENLFDTLSKELIRLQEERRIHAFTLIAERERRRREAEEGGRRQAEERRRREEDEIFRQVVQVHQETVDLYLEDIILETVVQTADQQTREEIRRMAEEVNDIAYAAEESRNHRQSEEIVAELVYAFLIPEVEKIRRRQRAHSTRRRRLRAARSVLHGTAEDAGTLPVLQGVSRSICPSERAAQRVLQEMIGQVEQVQQQESEQRLSRPE